jgi:hypothetical protein
MVSGSMPEGGVRVTTSPSEDRCTVNDEITCPNESRSESVYNGENEE